MRRPTLLFGARTGLPPTPYIVLIASLSLTLLATHIVDVTGEARDSLRFHSSVEETRNRIESRLQVYISLLRGGSGLFAAARVDAGAFHAFAERLQTRDRYPGIQGIGFAAYVTAAQKGAFEAAMRRSASPDYTVRPPGARPDYGAIAYLEPHDKPNSVAVGYDMLSEPVRRLAMETARDTGAESATGRVTLVQEIYAQKQPGFLIYEPVYAGGAVPPTLDRRRAALRGWVYAPFRTGDLLNGIVGSEADRAVSFRVYDGAGATDSALVYEASVTRNRNGRAYRPRYSETVRFAVAGRPWTLVFTSEPTFDRTAIRSQAPYVFLLGVALSGVLFGLTYAQALARLQAERTARELRQSEEALAARQAHIEALNEQLKRAMTETHHRVKNNLQIIAAMVDMQLMESEAAIPVGEVARLGGHVRALAAVHDILTQNAKHDAKAAAISGREVLEKLLPLLQATTGAGRLHFQLDEMKVSARQGTALALVANELVSNSLKHSDGEVDVRLTRRGAEAEMRVCDAGPGFPPDFSPETASNTGLELVDRLSRWDLGGAIRYENRPTGGACVTLTFPLPEGE